MMTVYAVSSRVRDEFLTLWPRSAARRRTLIIPDWGLLAWHRFGRLFVGVATYQEQRAWTPAGYVVWAERFRQHQAMLERERSWWRCVPELQRFVARHAGPGTAGDRGGELA